MADLIDKNSDTGQRKRQRSYSRQDDETKEFRQMTNNMMREIASLNEMILRISKNNGKTWLTNIRKFKKD